MLASNNLSSWGKRETYSLVLDLLGLAALERDPVALVLEALGGDEPLDLGRLGVGGLALTLGGDLTTNDVLADLLPDGALANLPDKLLTDFSCWSMILV